MSLTELPDLQQAQPPHRLALDAVGISRLRHPIVVVDKSQRKQETVGTISMSVDLAATARGAHLSRFLELLDEAAGELTVRTVPPLLCELRGRLRSASASIEIDFPYFIEKRAPVTGARGLLDVACRYSFSVTESELRSVLTITVPVTTLCPCSKAISDYGAHNQRCDVTISVQSAPRDVAEESDVVWIEDLVALAERHASSPVYPVLKRPDERFVTMKAYDNPAFVEDVARGVAADLSGNHSVCAFFIEVSSDESIHNHRAFARVGRPLTLAGLET